MKLDQRAHRISIVILALFVAQFAAADLWEDLAAFSGTDQVVSPPTQLNDLIVSTPADQLGEIETRLIALLTSSEATVEGKQVACQMLQRIGTAACIPAVGSLLTDASLSHHACLVLARLPDAAAGEALTQALGEATDEQRIGLLGSISMRADGSATAAAPYLTSGNSGLAKAAFEAMGRIGGDAAAKAVHAAKVAEDADPAVRAARFDAHVRCAQSIGDATALGQLLAGAETARQKVAAVYALVALNEAAGTTAVVAYLKGDDPYLRNAALSILGRAGNERLTRSTAAVLSELADEQKIAVLTALAQRRDPAALPHILPLLTTENGALAEAACKAAAAAGDATTALQLLDHVSGPHKTVALEALQSMTHPAVNASLIEAVQQESRAVAACTALGRREVREAKAALLAAGMSGEAAVQRAAWQALGSIATVEDLSDLMRKAAAMEDPKAARMVYGAVRGVCTIAPNKGACIQAIGAHYEAADDSVKTFILDLAAAAGGNAGIPYVHSALASENPVLTKKALRALAAWHDAAPVFEDLLKLARSAPDEKERIVALRGYLSQIGKLLDAGKAAQSLLGALDLITRPEEKRQLVAACGGNRHEHIPVIARYLDDPDVASEARLAMLEKGEHLKRRRRGIPESVVKALNDLVATTSDGRTRKRAQALLNHVNAKKKQNQPPKVSPPNFLNTWEIAGPYADVADPFAHAFAPETGKGTVAWRALTPNDFKGDLVDFYKSMPGDNRAVYLKTTLDSKIAGVATLELGSDDGVKVWLNGSLVHSLNKPRPCVVGDDTIDLALKPGANHLQVKVSQMTGRWEFGARLGKTRAQVPAPSASTPLWGDWQGQLTVNGKQQPLVAQVIPLADNQFRANLLPEFGAKPLAVLQGKAVDGKAAVRSAEGKETWDGTIGLDATFTGTVKGTSNGAFTLAPVQRTSPTLAKPAPPGAAVLFHGTGLDAWKAHRKGGNARWKIVDGALEVVPKTGSILSKQIFTGDQHIHLEFRTPFEPAKSGQGRGNSGVYIQGLYEVQVLDSYGLQSKDNDCGGVYRVATPAVNMCFPPLQWQTYDIDFVAPRFDQAGKKTSPARLTVRHNGVLIHENVTVPRATAASATRNEAQPLGLYLQDHSNRVQYRNIWVVEGAGQ